MEEKVIESENLEIKVIEEDQINQYMEKIELLLNNNREKIEDYSLYWHSLRHISSSNLKQDYKNPHKSEDLDTILEMICKDGFEKETALSMIIFGLVSQHIKVSGFTNSWSYGETAISHKDVLKIMNPHIRFSEELKTRGWYQSNRTGMGYALDDLKSILKAYKAVEFILENKDSILNKKSSIKIKIKFTVEGVLLYLEEMQFLFDAKRKDLETTISTTRGYVERFESNLLNYITIIIAVFALIGINFNYVSELISSYSFVGVLILNTCIAITLTLIFFLMDYSKSYHILDRKYKNSIAIGYFRDKGWGYIMLLFIELLVLEVSLIIANRAILG